MTSSNSKMPLAPPRHRELLEKLESQTYTEVANWLVEKYKFPDGNIYGIAQSVRRMDKNTERKKQKGTRKDGKRTSTVS